MESLKQEVKAKDKEVLELRKNVQAEKQVAEKKMVQVSRKSMQIARMRTAIPLSA